MFLDSAAVSNQPICSEIEKQAEGLTEWKSHIEKSITSNGSNISECMSVAPSSDIFFASSQSPASTSTGPTTAPAIHQEYPPGYPLLWSGIGMSLLHNKETIPQYHVTEAAEDGQFYPSPEACASPVSDGASLLLSPHPPASIPSIPSATDTAIDSYPQDTIRTDLTSSPLPMNSSMRCLDPGLNIANMISSTHSSDFVQSVSSF